jgi:hypothetical protein
MFFCLLMAEMAAATQAAAGQYDSGSNGSSSTMVRVQQNLRLWKKGGALGGLHNNQLYWRGMMTLLAPIAPEHGLW